MDRLWSVSIFYKIHANTVFVSYNFLTFYVKYGIILKVTIVEVSKQEEKIMTDETRKQFEDVISKRQQMQVEDKVMRLIADFFTAAVKDPNRSDIFGLIREKNDIGIDELGVFDKDGNEILKDDCGSTTRSVLQDLMQFSLMNVSAALANNKNELEDIGYKVSCTDSFIRVSFAR